MIIINIIIRIILTIGLIYLFFVLLNSNENDSNSWWLIPLFLIGSLVLLMGMPSSKE